MKPFLDLFPQNDFSLIAVVLLMPLLGAFVNGVFGRRLGKPAVRMMALTAVGVSFAAAIATFVALNGAVDAAHTANGEAAHTKLAWLAWEWMRVSGPNGSKIAHRPQVQRRRALRRDDARRHGRGFPHPRLLDRVHGVGQGVLALLLLPEPLHLLDARPHPRGQPAGALHRLGRGRSLLVPAHRLLVREAPQRGGRQEGVHRQPHRRLRPHRRDVPPRGVLRRPRLGRHPAPRQRPRRADRSPGRDQPLADRRRTVRGLRHRRPPYPAPPPPARQAVDDHGGDRGRPHALPRRDR